MHMRKRTTPLSCITVQTDEKAGGVIRNFYKNVKRKFAAIRNELYTRGKSGVLKWPVQCVKTRGSLNGYIYN